MTQYAVKGKGKGSNESMPRHGVTPTDSRQGTMTRDGRETEESDSKMETGNGKWALGTDSRTQLTEAVASVKHQMTGLVWCARQQRTARGLPLRATMIKEPGKAMKQPSGKNVTRDTRKGLSFSYPIVPQNCTATHYTTQEKSSSRAAKGPFPRDDSTYAAQHQDPVRNSTGCLSERMLLCS